MQLQHQHYPQIHGPIRPRVTDKTAHHWHEFYAHNTALSSGSSQLAGGVGLQTERHDTSDENSPDNFNEHITYCVFSTNNKVTFNPHQRSYCLLSINCPVHRPCLLPSPKQTLVQLASLPYFPKRNSVQLPNIYSYTEPRKSAAICAPEKSKRETVGREKVSYQQL